MTPKKILVPVDFSANSREAMRVAIRIANESGAELVLAHAWYIPAVAFGTEPYELSPMVIERVADDARRELDRALADAKQLGAARAGSVLVNGVPWSMLTEIAEDDPAFDRIVMGTHGRTGIKRFLLGSVAEKVVRHAPCSVLVVRPDREPAPFTDVLCPVDFSPSSEAAVEIAARLVRPGGSGLTLMHAVEAPVAFGGETFPADFVRDLDKSAARSLEQLATRLRAKLEVPVLVRTRVGYAGAQILAVLDDDPVFDLVVMGSHGRSGIRRALLGSVAEKIVRHAPCPVLVGRHR
jgi:nucleotide-binding universal stress UspA family protein